MGTKRFIRYFSKHIYRYLTRVFSFKLAIDERGLNDHLVFSIAEYCYKQGFADVLIYKSRAPKKEKDYGHDFDLFVECEPDRFAYFALQAKVMDYNGRYAGFDASKRQWEKMKKHEQDFNSKAFYMFYNGKYLKSSIPTPTRRDYLGSIPKVEEYGIGIVENCEVERVATIPRKSSISFTDFFPHQMDAFKKLFYCSCHDLGVTSLSSLKDIYRNPPYALVTYKQITSPEENSQNSDMELPEGAASIRIIVKKHHEK